MMNAYYHDYGFDSIVSSWCVKLFIFFAKIFVVRLVLCTFCLCVWYRLLSVITTVSLLFFSQSNVDLVHCIFTCHLHAPFFFFFSLGIFFLRGTNIGGDLLMFESFKKKFVKDKKNVSVCVRRELKAYFYHTFHNLSRLLILSLLLRLLMAIIED